MLTPTLRWLLPVLLTLPVSAQTFINTGFEYGNPQHYPLVWETNEGAGTGTVRVDSGAAYQGRKSLRLAARNSPVLLAGLRFSMAQVGGRTVCITGYLRTDSLRGGSAGLFYYDYGRRAFVADTQAVSGTTPWKAYSYTFTINPAAGGEGIVVGIKAGGTGDVYFDQVTLTLDGKPLDDSPYFPGALSARQRGRLNRQAIPLPAETAVGEAHAWRRFKQLVGPARIVALGENAHGSGTAFRIKHQLLKYLVAEMGFTVLALEAPAPEADRINAYVLGGDVSRDEVVQHLGFKSWQTEEVLDVIEWLRAYNRTHRPQVRFAGFDVQSRTVALENLARFARQHDPALAQRVDSLAALLARNPLPDSLHRVAYGKAQALAGWFTGREGKAYAGADPAAWRQVERDAMILQQHIGLPLLRNRRESMARNIIWLEEHTPPGSKIVVWAGNGHVSKEGVNMGNALARHYGAAYLAVGFTFARGTYAAYGPELYYPAVPAYPGTYEYCLGQAKYPRYVLDLRPSRVPGAWLRRPLEFRSLEPEPLNHQFRQTNLTEHFDALVFFGESVHSVYLQP